MTHKITAKELRELLDYDPATGIFVWRARPAVDRHVRRWNTKHAGKVAGNRCRLSKTHKTDYVVIGVHARRYLAHRLAWLHVHGEWPADEIDHRDLDGTNNAIENLRHATRTQNGINRIVKVGASGYRGVTWSHKLQTWRAQIRDNGRMKYLGCFGDPRVAHEAYLAARKGVHPEFARAS